MATDLRERLLADLQFGAPNGVALTLNGVVYAPAIWYLGLSKTTPNEDGTNFTEPIGMGYARIGITNNFTNFPLAVTTLGQTTKQNGVKFTFANPTGTWGSITDFGWFTTPTGGLPDFPHEMDDPIFIQSTNTPVEFDIGQLVMVWD